MLRDAPYDWRGSLGLARTVIAHLDCTGFMQQPSRTNEQTWVLTTLQKLASMDADNGAVTDIMAWCTAHWLRIHQHDPQDLAALRGIGQAWLSRAQPALARIQRSERSSTRSGSSSSRHTLPNGTATPNARQVQQAAAADTERRVGSPDFVEARGLLQPATEYLDRAVAAASMQQAITGNLLAVVSTGLVCVGLHSMVLTWEQTAEAYMFFGNVSSPRTNEATFRRALQLLRAATLIPDYTLCRHLQQYVTDSFGS